MTVTMKKTVRVALSLVLVLFMLVPFSFSYADEGAGGAVGAAAGAAEGTTEGADEGADGSVPSDAEGTDPADPADSADPADPADPEDAEGTDPVGTDPEGTADPAGTDPDPTDPASPDDSAQDSLEPLATVHKTPLPAGRYRIRPAVSDVRMLDINQGSKKSGANVQIYRSNNSANQLFDVSYDAEGFYTIKSVSSGLVLDVYGAKAKQGANVIQNEASKKSGGQASQKWVLAESAGVCGMPVYTVESALSSSSNKLMLDTYGGTDADCTNVQVWSENASLAQKFYFVPLNAGVVSKRTVDDGMYSLTTALSSSFAADIAGAQSTSGAQLQLWSFNGKLAQLFDIKRQSDGFYTIRPLGSGKMLDASGSHVVASTPVIQWPNTGGDNQRWAIADNGDGTYSFIAKTSGLVLDVEGGRMASGTKLSLYYPHGGKNQRFKLDKPKTDPLWEGIVTIASFADMSKVVDIEGHSAKSGARALIYKSHGGMNQKFQVTRTGPATYAFSALVSGMYLTAGNGAVHQAWGSGGQPTAKQQWVASWGIGGARLTNVSTNEVMTVNSDKATLGVAAASSSSSQSFRINGANPVNPGYYMIRSASGYALDLHGASINSGANVQFYTANTGVAQKWKLELGSDGYYTIANARSQKVIDISGGGTKEGTNILVWDKIGVAWQKWKFVPSGDGWFYLRSATGMYLSVSGEGNYNSANVYASTAVTKSAQRFRFIATTYTGYVGTYADVNLTTQKMIYVKNGELILESDIVSGAPSMRTPTGTFRVLYKQSPAVLRGPGYASPVTYWMPFTSSGVGFHDANWQSRFGGDWYKSHGSHGCINMPFSAAKTLYGKISAGDTVKVHY